MWGTKTLFSGLDGMTLWGLLFRRFVLPTEGSVGYLVACGSPDGATCHPVWHEAKRVMESPLGTFAS
ncbi:hypothetical protein [Rhodopirellula baltica]|uniref:Uncharacterized protein n=1 Tax=Rhodopirellula baltica SWK14 TaxID=993516 RepID=L7CIB1_RHOBT|nr:hypothetical protein [Rhodopirellula baltica]ELP33372.1 hypothetical protein RBSWK_02682 [Rhodopirellula baltica SWK14]